jgi:hypothetical protein
VTMTLLAQEKIRAAIEAVIRLYIFNGGKPVGGVELAQELGVSQQVARQRANAAFELQDGWLSIEPYVDCLERRSRWRPTREALVQLIRNHWSSVAKQHDAKQRVYRICRTADCGRVIHEAVCPSCDVVVGFTDANQPVIDFGAER